MVKNPYIQAGKSTAMDVSRLPGYGKRVIVAMSGGVDSSVAAVMLKEQGYEVIGIALQTTDYSKFLSNESGGTCCSIKDMEDARRVAEKIGIPFYVLNTEKVFDSLVVNYFINDYLQGRTPNPCAVCNTKVKFNYLYKKALDMGADFVATGHYAKLSKEPDLGYTLWRSNDLAKDQTYFLFNLNQAQLSRTLFPIGHLTKTEVRKKALQFGLPVSEKPDSQEICFVPPEGYAKFIESRTSERQRKPGFFVTTDFKVLGNHTGFYQFTIGQRKGLGEALDYAKRLELPEADTYVVLRLDPIKGQVILGPEKLLKNWGLVASHVNFIVPPNLMMSRRVQVKIRHRAEAIESEIRLAGDNRVEVRFVEAQRAVTPGQACVFYDGNMCLGGGWILETLQVAEADRPKVSLNDSFPSAEM